MRARLLSALLIAAALCAPARAGTTGTIIGRVTELDSSVAVADAIVTASSPSQSAATTTDQGGHFTFISLAPDRYTITAEKRGYDRAVQDNVRVLADNSQSIVLSVKKQLVEIAHVYSRSAMDLVKAGTTSDVYSVNSTVAEKAQALGGGGGLNNAYSAIAMMPGVFVPQGQQGYYQAVYVRGADFNALGYEYDGVPVNRAFDNYAGGTGSNLGQQELQLYTSGGPASASANGIAGFINQVIRTGTYPGYGTLDLQAGAPAYYHKLGAEIGAASPDRRFSYYAGFAGYNQDFRLVDQSNGGGVVFPYFAFPILGPFAFGLVGGAAPMCVGGAPPKTLPPGIAIPSCYTFAPGNLGNTSSISDREGVLNLHFAVPHKHDGGRDDVQLLLNTSALNAYVYDSQLDIGPSTIANAFGGPLHWRDAVVFPAGTHFGEPVSQVPVTGNPECAQCVTYFFPSSPTNRSAQALLPLDKRGGQETDAAIVKLQYQKNIGSSGYWRLFGYSFYSDLIQNDPNAAATLTYGNIPDYELSAHTRGAELQFAKQLSPKHLIKATANYTTASTVRFNNSTMGNSPGSRVTNLVDAAGNCYDAAGNVTACNGGSNQGSFAQPAPYPAIGTALAAKAQWIVTGASAGFSQNGILNTVVPKFTSMSFEDQFKPNDRLFLNLGLRYERFGYTLGDSNNPGYNFWFRAAQREFCYDPVTLKLNTIFGQPVAITPGTPCPIDPSNGVREVHPDGIDGHLLMSNDYSRAMASSVLSPRIALTYTIDPDTVLRASAGRYAQPTATAFTQYLSAQPNWPATFPMFWNYGFTTPRHDVLPQISDTYDISYERHLRGTGIEFKVTPFLRNTANQQQEFFLDPITGFASSFNVGRQTSYGFEVAATTGDLSRDGIAASLAYTYTNARIRFDDFRGSSRNVIDIVNDQIRTFNGFTAAGGGFPCYQNTTTGTGTGETAVQCAADFGAILNPYFKMPIQPLFDRHGSYYPYDIFATIPGSPTNSFFSPHVFSGVLQYKRGRITVSPSFELNAGTHYGAPLNVPGVDPSSCGQNSATAGIKAPDPRQAEYTSCAGTLSIPDPENGNRYDRFGAFQNPWQLSINAQVAYSISPKVTATLVFANIVNRCFGGSTTPWSRVAPPGSHGVCSYNGNFSAPYVSNLYNGFSPNDAAANGGPLNPYIAHAYAATGFSEPFEAFFQLQIKI